MDCQAVSGPIGTVVLRCYNVLLTGLFAALQESCYIMHETALNAVQQRC